MAESIIFEGRVIPEALHTTIPDPVHIIWRANNIPATCQFVITIQDAALTVECTPNEAGRALNYREIYRRAFDTASGLVDTIGFANGWYLQAIFDFVIEDGVRSPIIVGIPELSTISRQFPGNDKFEPLLELIVRDPFLFLALNDLVTSLSTPHYAIVHQMRALDGIRHMIAGGEKKRERTWEMLREALRADKAYLKYITDASDKPRHAEHTGVHGSVIAECSKRSWTLMNRFLEYRRRGSQPLPLSEFPELTG